MQEQYKVVVNDEEQYSIWALRRDNAPGWRDTGISGDKQHCLDRIEEIWLDMRPRSVRERLATSDRSRA